MQVEKNYWNEYSEGFNEEKDNFYECFVNRNKIK